MKKKKIVVLGHSGFLGSVLFKQANEIENTEVHGFSSKELDLLDESSVSILKEAFSDGAIVIVSAAITSGSGNNDFDLFKKNVRIALHVGQACRDSGIGKLVFISSDAVYGEHEFSGIITEDSPLKSTSFYGASKIVGESIISQTGKLYGVPTLIVRPTILYGPRNLKSSYNPTAFIKDALDSKKIVLYGKGDDVRDFLFVEDAARLILHLSLGKFGGIYNIATGSSSSFLEVAEVIQKRLPSTKIVYKERKIPMSKHFFDTGKLQCKIPKEECVPLRKGIDLTVSSFE